MHGAITNETVALDAAASPAGQALDAGAANTAVEDPTAGDRDLRITAYAIDRLYRNWPGTMLALIASAILTGGLVWQRVNHLVILAWVATVILLKLANYGLTLAYRRRQPPPSDARRWADYFTLISLLMGLVWGSTGILFFVPDSLFLQLIVFVYIGGLVAGSAAVLSYWLPAFYANALPAILMSTVFLATKGTPEYLGLAAFALLYFSVINLVARNQKRTAYEAISLRFENIDLIEQLRQQKNVAEQANIAKSKFLAAASHDLRQPLHALGLFVAALSEPRALTDSPGIIRNISRSLAALEGLFNALLDISKLDAGIVKPEIRDVTLEPLLERLSAEYESQARLKQIGWRYRSQDAVVRTDIVLLETVLRNLIGNAIRYTARGEVWLDCVGEGEVVSIEIGDTGIGIPASQHREVFREFVQLSNPERDRTKGLGLGLAIVARLTTLLGHALEMRSAPGVGTVFHLRLPLGDVETARNAEPPADASISEDSPLRVLVIEDELHVQEAMTTLLRSWGHEVVAVVAEDAALEISPPAPDVIIADYRLRENRTGIDAIRRLSDHWEREIPSLVVTGDTSPDRLRQAQQSGLAFLHKPVSPGKLRAFLRGVQRDRRSRPAA